MKEGMRVALPLHVSGSATDVDERSRPLHRAAGALPAAVGIDALRSEPAAQRELAGCGDHVA